MTWKARQMRIWVITEKSSGAEMRPEGGDCGTSSVHAGFKLTGGGEGRERDCTPRSVLNGPNI